MAVLTNAQMTPNRFAKWAYNRRKLRWMREQWAAGRVVYIASYTRTTKATAKHADMFKADARGLWMQSGKNWVDVGLCQVSAR